MSDRKTDALLDALNGLASAMIGVESAIRENTNAVIYAANVQAGEYEGDELESDAPNGYDLAGRPL